MSAKRQKLNQNRTSAAASEAPTSSPGIRKYDFNKLSEEEKSALLQRPRVDFTSILALVAPIVENVAERGDEAVSEYTKKFDGVELSQVVVPIDEFDEPVLAEDVKTAFDVAYENIKAFHMAQKDVSHIEVSTMPGVTCRRVSRPIDAVGLYVPGGTAILPSTALMLAVPGQIAGCETMVLATPPRKDGTISPEVLYVAKKAGVTHVLKAGGAQAVAAMAHGTATCPKVDKIFGPGNQFVTAAKMLIQNSDSMTSIDMPAGPSEVLVIADADAPPAHVAADLLSQAEHGKDSQVVLLTLPGADVDAIAQEVEDQCNALPRGDLAKEALGHSYLLEMPSVKEAQLFSNRYAPEHLIVNVDDAASWLPDLTNAGSIFLGRWTPESVGDYASGTNHVLPTYGYAKMYSGVSLDSFQKHMTVQELTEDGLKLLGPHVATMCSVEGLDAHRRAVTKRLGMPDINPE